MPDLTKHIARAKQALERRNYDLVIEVCSECVDVDPANIDIHKINLDAARRKAKESGKKSMMPTMGFGFSKDPHKVFVSAFKKIAAHPDNKIIVEVGDAALKLSQSGTKPMAEVAQYYYEEMRASGMFNDKVLWNLAFLYFEKFKETKDRAWLDKALKTMAELEKAMPNHPEAGKQVKNWEAMRSMEKRDQAGTTGDYRSQLASDDKARRAEIMNRMIRTPADAMEVLKFVEEDLVQNQTDKNLWMKKGDIHRRINQMAEAKAAYEKGQTLDEHDFTITMKLGDLRMEEAKGRIAAMKAAGQDASAATKELLMVETEEYRKRVERQPTDMSHRYNLGLRLLQAGSIDLAAGEFQRTVNDPRLRRGSHRYLGYCFAKKNLLDLASKQYDSYLTLVDDEQSDEAKEVRYALARVYEDQKKKDDAIKNYERLVALDLGYKDAATRLSRLRGDEAPPAQ
ncbi:MAG: tetratricopeptide repeat protein [Planctomycetes bacterium]|nr:tetratricopeptide repeat protein [Planctomycetota bacterium]